VRQELRTPNRFPGSRTAQLEILTLQTNQPTNVRGPVLKIRILREAIKKTIVSQRRERAKKTGWFSWRQPDGCARTLPGLTALTNRMRKSRKYEIHQEVEIAKAGHLPEAAISLAFCFSNTAIWRFRRFSSRSTPASSVFAFWSLR